MDSLTQIVLGAACGELVAGKKLGNKAILLGAIGGTIPDLDVIIAKWIFNAEIDQLAFHRGFMHSVFFAFLAPFLLSYISQKIGKLSFREYYWLWFWPIFTHPILDCFTGYGTQLFTPISDMRVAWTTISVVDPLYTVPFLICMIALMFYKRTSVRRRRLLYVGLGVSSLYLAFTVFNKFHINSVMKESLTEKNITMDRFMTQPTIFNNILWYSVAENEDNFYTSSYSILDASTHTIQWDSIPKSFPTQSNYVTKKLEWFSEKYCNFKTDSFGNAMRYYDLRYPLRVPGDMGSAVFQFDIFQNNEGEWDIKPFTPNMDNMKSELSNHWERIKGI